MVKPLELPPHEARDDRARVVARRRREIPGFRLVEPTAEVARAVHEVVRVLDDGAPVLRDPEAPRAVREAVEAVELELHAVVDRAEALEELGVLLPRPLATAAIEPAARLDPPPQQVSAPDPLTLP